MRPAQTRASARQAARNTRLIFAHQAADFLKGEFVEVVEVKPQAIARREFGERGDERLLQCGDLTRAVGFRQVFRGRRGGGVVLAGGRLVECRAALLGAIGIDERCEITALSQVRSELRPWK